MTKIMVVDDEAEILNVVRLALEEEDFEVVEAADGCECLKKLGCEKPDLILLDVMMPGIDGWRTCKLIKENEKTKSIPVCMLTVLSREVEWRTSRDLALADGHINKPFDKKELVKIVKLMLENPARELVDI